MALGISKAELLGMPSVTTSNIKFSLPEEDQAPIVAALQLLDAHLKSLDPILQDSGREMLRKWAAGTSTAEEVSNALDAMSLATRAMVSKIKR